MIRLFIRVQTHLKILGGLEKIIIAFPFSSAAPGILSPPKPLDLENKPASIFTKLYQFFGNHNALVHEYCFKWGLYSIKNPVSEDFDCKRTQAKIHFVIWLSQGWNFTSINDHDDNQHYICGVVKKVMVGKNGRNTLGNKGGIKDQSCE